MSISYDSLANCDYRFATPFLVSMGSFVLDMLLFQDSIRQYMLNKHTRHTSTVGTAFEWAKLVEICISLLWSEIKSFWFWNSNPSFTSFIDCELLREINEGFVIKVTNLYIIYHTLNLNSLWVGIFLGCLLLLVRPLHYSQLKTRSSAT